MEEKRKRGRPAGGTKFKNAELQFHKKTLINPKAKIENIKAVDENAVYKCTCCGKEFKNQRNNFSPSSSPLYASNNHYINVCKTCLDKYYLQLVNYFSGNEEKAIERCCQLFDWYYSLEAVAMTQKCLSIDKTRIGLYPSKTNMTQVQKKGTTYLDTIRERNGVVIDTIEDLPEELTEDEQSLINAEDIKFFGGGYKPDEYIYLKEQYSDWVTRYECTTKAQEELFKTICIASLSIRQAQQQKNQKAATDAMKAFQDLLGTAKLQPKQTNDNSLVEQNTLGTLIKKWEDEQPIPEPSPEFQDVDNIKKYIDTYFLGHLAKMMGIENDYSKEYDEEMAHYTVEKPQYFEDVNETTSEENSDDNSGQ